MGRNRVSNKPPVDMSSTEPFVFADQFDPEEVEEHRLDYDLDSMNRCIQRFRQWKGQTIWFAVMQQTLVGDEWVDVARIDTCHDESHIHRFAQRGSAETRTTLSAISSIRDVESAFDEACDMLMDNWDKELRRWEQ